MEKLIVSATLAMALAWAAPARADATGHAGGHKKPTHASGHATMPAGKHGAVDCAAPVPLMVAAEHKPGGCGSRKFMRLSGGSSDAAHEQPGTR
jgi:hypothetical protein